MQQSQTYKWLIACLAATVASVSALVLFASAAGIAVGLSWACLVSCTVAIMIRCGRFDILSPAGIFLGAYTVIFAVRPTYEVLRLGSGRSFLGYQVDEGFPGALLLGCLGLVCFTVGYLSRRVNHHDLVRPTSPHKRERNRELDLTTAARMTLLRRSTIVALGAIALFGLFIYQNGGVGLLASIASGRSSETALAFAGASGYLYSAPMAATGVGVLLFLLYRSTRRWIFLLASVALLVFSLFVAGGQGSRSVLLPTVLTLVIAHYLYSRRRPKPLAIGLAVALIFIFGISLPRVFRESGDLNTALSQEAGGALDLEGSFDAFMLGADTAMVDALAIEITAVPERIDYTFGSTYLGALLRPIPSDLIDKPVASADQYLNARLFPATYESGTGFSFSVMGEPYLNFGIVGVAIVLFLLGLGSAVLAKWYAQGEQSIREVLIYSAAVPFLFVFMRGGLSVDYHRVLIAVVPLIYVTGGLRQAAVGRQVRADSRKSVS